MMSYYIMCTTGPGSIVTRSDTFNHRPVWPKRLMVLMLTFNSSARPRQRFGESPTPALILRIWETRPELDVRNQYKTENV
jgi:hypothetical protein